MPEGVDVEMTPFNYKRDCANIYRHIRMPHARGGCMPYKTGRLANQATTGRLFGNDIYVITISGNMAPYAASLEDGSKPHNIPKAFGKPLPFGTMGRFDGKFHPGSKKWKGFISDYNRDDAIIGYALSYFKSHYDAIITYQEG